MEGSALEVLKNFVGDNLIATEAGRSTRYRILRREGVGSDAAGSAPRDLL
jgi:hypothetical protein